MIAYMARKIEVFPGSADGPRRYPWPEWTDGDVWEIRRGEDYDVATENMRVTLHMKARDLSCKVRTRSVRGDGEGLVFQFLLAKEDRAMTTVAVEDADDAVDRLYEDAVNIYEVARREVTIPRRNGGTQKYAAVRYKQLIDRAYAEGQLVGAITKIVSRRTEGFGHLEAAGRPDLMAEVLVIDPTKPYHGLFSPETIRIAQARMNELAVTNDEPAAEQGRSDVEELDRIIEELRSMRNRLCDVKSNSNPRYHHFSAAVHHVSEAAADLRAE
jgi:hypothetical protein